MTPSFGVAVTTLNRRELFTTTIDHIRANTPTGTPIIVVDDGSDHPVPPIDGVTLIRHATPRGIARSKNACIATLMDAGVDHLFMFDDDAYPTEPGWEQAYIGSGEQHLSLQLRWRERCRRCRTVTMHNYNTVRGFPTCNVCQPAQAVFEDDRIHAVQWGSGVMMYFTRACIDRIGGFRTEYGRYGIEHWDIATRACNAGLIRYPFMDVLNPKIHAVDAHSRGPRSSVPAPQRAELLARNWELFDTHYKNATDFVPYLEPPVTERVTVCIPRRDTPDRFDAHQRCEQWWNDHGFTVVNADSTPGEPFSCSQARNNAARQAGTNIIVLADADTIPDSVDQISAAVDLLTAGADMVYPFTRFVHIDKLWALKPGDEYKKAPIQQSYANSPGGIFVLHADTLWRYGGFDERFRPGVTASGACFGYDDTSFKLVAETLGTVKRVTGTAWSFNHATTTAGKPDRDFSTTNPNLARHKLYLYAAGKPDVMAELIR